MTYACLRIMIFVLFLFMHLQWNVADYFNQNKEKLLCNNGSDGSKQRGARSNIGEIPADGNNSVETAVTGFSLTDQQELLYPDFPGVTTLAEMSEFDKLWMCLFTKLGKFHRFKL